MSLLETIKSDLAMLRQMVRVAKEAKAKGWCLEGMDPRFRATSPGDLYEWQMSQIPKMIDKIEGNIKKLEGKISCMNTKEELQMLWMLIPWM